MNFTKEILTDFFFQMNGSLNTFDERVAFLTSASKMHLFAAAAASKFFFHSETHSVARINLALSQAGPGVPC